MINIVNRHPIIDNEADNLLQVNSQVQYSGWSGNISQSSPAEAMLYPCLSVISTVVFPVCFTTVCRISRFILNINMVSDILFLR